MATKKKTASRKKTAVPDTAHSVFAIARVAAHSLINMIVVIAACGTTLATLMAALRFQLA